MHKEEFSKHIAYQHNITQKAAHDVIDTFTSSVIDAMGQGKEISFVGFGNFSIGKVAARTGIVFQSLAWVVFCTSDRA